MINVKVHKSYRDVVAICDSELIGKFFEEGENQLDVKESFYKGDKQNLEGTKNIIEKMSVEDATFNIVGKKAIQCAIDCEIISENNVKKIQEVPFTLVLL